ncbi:MAG: metallophosphoesterase family protein [Methylococcus sp.]
MKIIHISDTHVGHGNNENRLERVVEDILSLGPPRQHIVIHTGDLINAAHPELMDIAEPILKRLTQRGWRVLLTPGNHDYGNALKVDKEWAKCFRERFRPYLFGEAACQDQEGFPVLTVMGDCAFIGLDSNEGELSFWLHWMAEGFLDDPQIQKLKAMLDGLQGKTIVVYLHHHPFQDAYAVDPEPGQRFYVRHILGLNTRRFRRLKDAHALLQCLRDRAHILLFGHQHFGLDYSAETRRYGIALALDASSTTRSREETHQLSYRIIDTRTLNYETRFVNCTG